MKRGGSPVVAFGYRNGDFNYDRSINGDDYFIIDSNISTAQNAVPFPRGADERSLTADFGERSRVVPEPAGMTTLLVLSAWGMERGRARRRRSSAKSIDHPGLRR